MALNFKTKLKRQNNDYNMGFIGCLQLFQPGGWSRDYF